MGFYFRRSMNVGPFRVNLSRGGVGWSVGSRGFRTGTSGSGRRYTTISVPGTGMGYRTSRGCLLMLVAPMVGLVVLLTLAARAAGVLA